MKYLDYEGLSALTSQIKSADSKNATAISTETTNRTNADTALSNRITSLESWKTTMTSDDTDTVINTFKEVQAFLADYTESDTLKSIIDATKKAASDAVAGLDVAAIGAGNNTQVITKVSETDGKISATATNFSSFLGTTSSLAYPGNSGATNATNISNINTGLGKQSIKVTESTTNAATAGTVVFTYATGGANSSSVTITSISQSEIDALFK